MVKNNVYIYCSLPFKRLIIKIIQNAFLVTRLDNSPYIHILKISNRYLLMFRPVFPNLYTKVVHIYFLCWVDDLQKKKKNQYALIL